jgi:hypothetical protein
MTLLIALLFAAPAELTATVAVPRVTLAAINQPASSITATYSRSATIDPDTDNAPVINAFLDSLPEGATANLPAGTWPINSGLQINKTRRLRGAGMNATIIVGRGDTWSGAVVGFGDYHQNVKVNNVILEDLTVRQEGRTPNAPHRTHTCIFGHGDHFRGNRIKLEGSQYEGVVIGGDSIDAVFTECGGVNCGNGGPAYERSTAAFNCHTRNGKYIRCWTKGCGQAVEAGTNGMVIDDCTFEEPGSGTPSIAVNLGSSNWGIYNVTVRNCRIRGYPDSIGTGNGNGRLCRVNIVNNVVDGTIGFGGGLPNNLVPGNPFEGPDLYGSTIHGNTIFVKTAHGGVILYNTGPSASYAVFGRENLSIRRNVIVNLHPASASQSGRPVINFAGNITAASVECFDNWLVNFDSDGQGAGDIASYSNNECPAVPGFPTLKHGRNRVFKWDGTERAAVVRIEGLAL